MDSIAKIQKEIDVDLATCTTLQKLEELKIKYLGKKGSLQALMKELKAASAEDRPRVGKEINDVKELVTFKIESLEGQLFQKELNSKLEKEAIDVTMPGNRRFAGRKHILTQTFDKMISILKDLGFSVETGPDIDTDFYNFEALNFPPNHPARDMQDTFYLDASHLLRTHTSNIQARVMESKSPPIRVIAPGRVYRNEAISARAHVLFHQIEAFYVDKNVSLRDLLATLHLFFAKLFEKEVETRFRPSYFPFVEPGVEVDIRCISCQGQGCFLCKRTGWLEVAGAGLIHPEVLKIGGIDPEVYSGFAWGMGLERLCQLLTGINDIRLFTENDLRFLKQFPGV